jgi:hypothetical protein
MEVDETDSRANCRFLVQIDAHRVNVAFTRPVRVPDVWPAVSGVLARSFASHIARADTTVRDAGPKRPGIGN